MENRQINAEDEIDLIKLFQTLWKKMLLILLTALISALVFLGGTLLLISPRYEATASFYVNNSSFTFGATSFSISSSELTASNSLVNTYVYFLQSRTTLEEIIANVQLDYSYEELSKMITAEAVPGTGAFEVTVKSKSPHESEKIANAVARILPNRILELVDGSSVRIVDYAIVPAHRASPSYALNTFIGFAAGAFLAVVCIVLRFLRSEQSDGIIHNADELRRLYPKYHVLALIPDMRLSEKKGYYYSSYYGSTGKGEK